MSRPRLSVEPHPDSAETQPRSAETILSLVAARARAFPGHPAVFQRRAGAWHAMSLTEVLEASHGLAQALRSVGLTAGDRLGIMCRTRVEWLLAELAAMMAGVVVVGIDAHASDAHAAQILDDSQASALLVDSTATLARLGGERWRRIALIVVIDAEAHGDEAHGGEAHGGQAHGGEAHGREAHGETLAARLHFWPALARPGEKMPEAAGGRTRGGADGALAHAAWPECTPQAPAALLYTSGTTGKPRPIVYRQRQLAAACRSILDEFPGIARPGGTTICWLPMAALFQRMMNYVALASGVAIYFVEEPAAITKAAKEVNPTYFVGVPRFFEKLYQGIQQELAARPRSVRKLVGFAVARSPRIQRGRRRAGGRVVARALDTLVLRRLRGVLGRRLRFMITGSAPTPVWMLEYFHRLGILLLEAYGLSENTVPVAANRPDAYRFGSVGKVFKASEVRLADDGEILVRGPGLFDGYADGAGAPAAAFTSDGFYRTGDLGSIDADGFLTLTGRKSDVFKTSTGRWIAPARIESAYRKIPYVEQIFVTGRGRPYPVALLTVNPGALAAALRERGIAAPDPARLHDLAAVRAQIAADLEVAGAELNAYERIRRYDVLPAPLSLEAGELTPSLKLRRDVIERRHQAQIDRIYAQAS